VRPSGIFRGTEFLLLSAGIAAAMQKPLFEDYSAKNGDRVPFTRSGFMSSVIARQSQASSSVVIRAEQLVRDGKYQEAYDLLAPLETSLSGDSRFNYLLGRAALGIGQADKAKMLFERSIALRRDIRRMNEAARAEYLATDEARRGVMLTLASDVSQAYFELLGLRFQLEIARETAQSYSTTLDLFTERLHGGISDALQTSRAAGDLATAAASIPELERLIALKENQIGVLIGQNPGAIETKVKLLEEVIPLDVPAGLPSALLERRPDVRSAAQTVRAANAQIGVAQSTFFPAIGLTTFFGKLSTPLSELTSGNTNAWSIAPNVAGPIFHFGGLKARKRQAIANWEQATAQYRQTALSAFRDVSDALISRENYETIRGELIQGVQANQEAVKLARIRYLEGLSSYVEVLDALQRLYPAQLALAQTEVNRRLVVIQLYKALGGGWNLTDAEFMTACCSPVVQGNQP
jgi:outer membrane protein, multidrug efflux system